MAKATKEQRDKLATIRARLKAAVDHDRENRQAALEDIKFAGVPGEQWDEVIRAERGDRPCYEFNRLRVT